jgi:hypothetical protein
MNNNQDAVAMQAWPPFSHAGSKSCLLIPTREVAPSLTSGLCGRLVYLLALDYTRSFQRDTTSTRCNLPEASKHARANVH